MAVQAKKLQKLEKRGRGRPKGTTKQRVQAGKGREAVTAEPLPAPVEVPSLENRPAEIPESGGGLLAGVRNLFQSSPAPVIQQSGEGVSDYSQSSPGLDSDGPLSPESARLLASVPDSIGGGPAGAPGGSGGPSEGDSDPIAELMSQVAFEPQDVQDVLVEVFDWIAERARSDHWKLTERQSRMLGRPLAQVLNASWLKVQSYIPSILGRWCESTPGAMALLTAAGLVIGPKVAKQFSVSRERRQVAPMVKERVSAAPAAAAPLPARPAGGGIVFDQAA